MAKLIKQYNENFTTVSNEIFKDKNISLKTKGLFMVMWQLPEEWNFTIRGLTSICKEGVNSINKMIIELEELGYLKREYIRETNGRIKEADYVLYDTKKPCIENEDMDNRDVETCDSNKELKELNTNLKNKLNNKHIKAGDFENFDSLTLEIQDAFEEYLEVRKKKKLSNSPRVINRLLNFLKGRNEIEKLEIIETAITYSWKDFWEIAKKNNSEQDKKQFGQYKNVLLTEDEYLEMQILFKSRKSADLLIEILDGAIETKGYKYDSHFAIMTNRSEWIVKKASEMVGNQPSRK